MTQQSQHTSELYDASAGVQDTLHDRTQDASHGALDGASQDASHGATHDASQGTLNSAAQGAPDSALHGGAPAVMCIRDVYKNFGATPVLKGISLEVKQGEVVAIIGPSGGGKSTLLRCLTLLENIERGTLTYGDVCVAHDDPRTAEKLGSSGAITSVYAPKEVLSKARSAFGLVFQQFNLFPHMSVLRNITDPLIRVDHVPAEQAKQRAYELLGKMGLANKADAVPCELSGGQKQRVAIARALAKKPSILYFDEPTSALDPELTRDVLNVIQDLAQEHMTMVIVTHEMSFARDVADRIIFMDGGVIVEQGSARQLIDSPREERTRAFLSTFSHA